MTRPISEEDIAELLAVDAAGWLREIPQIREYYAKFGDRMPAKLSEQLDALEERLSAS